MAAILRRISGVIGHLNGVSGGICLLRSDEILKYIAGPKVLDVGCTDHIVKLGKPEWLHGRLRERFPDVIGIDISQENLNTMRANGFDNLHLQNAESFSLPEKFNTIVAGELIEHLGNPGRFLDAARAHLAEGGRVVVSTPYAFSLLYFVYAFLKFPKTCQNEEHAVWFCVQTMKELASRSHFDITEFEMVEDYDPNDESGLYRLFVRLIRLFRLIIPGRLRKNAMIFVLTPCGETATAT